MDAFNWNEKTIALEFPKDLQLAHHKVQLDKESGVGTCELEKTYTRKQKMKKMKNHQ